MTLLTLGAVPVELAATGVSVALEEVTPQLAARYLDQRGVNRRLDPGRAAVWAAAMTRGEWLFTHQGLAFDRDGQLLDGQHRLDGIVRSGVAVPLLVVRGLDPAVLRVIDTGRKRTVADALRIDGERDPVGLAAACVWIARYESGQILGKARAVTVAQVDAILAAHPGLREAHFVPHRAALGEFLPPSLCFWLFYACGRADPARARQFFVSLATGVELPGDAPVYVLRERLRQVEGGTEVRALARRAGLVVKAWAATLAGRPLGVLRYEPESEPFPEIPAWPRPGRRKNGGAG